MNKLVFLLLLATNYSLLAYDSGIAVQTEKGTTMQVYVNGKLYNKQPGQFVRVRSTPGLFHLEVKVLNPWNKKWYIVRKDIRVDKGFEFQLGYYQRQGDFNWSAEANFAHTKNKVTRLA